MKFHVHTETTVTLLNGNVLGVIEKRDRISEWLKDLQFQKGERVQIPTKTKLDDPEALQWAWFVGTGKFRTQTLMGIYVTSDESLVLIPVSTVETFQANCQRVPSAAVARQFQGGYATA